MCNGSPLIGANAHFVANAFNCWAESYFAALKRAQPAIQSYQAQQNAQQATEQHCFDLAHTLIPGSDQASAQAADRVRIACDSEFGVP
jgi:hypothetical protein